MATRRTATSCLKQGNRKGSELSLQIMEKDDDDDKFALSLHSLELSEDDLCSVDHDDGNNNLHGRSSSSQQQQQQNSHRSTGGAGGADNNSKDAAQQQQQQQQQQQENATIARTETRTVRGLKLLVLAVLLGSMILVALGVYRYTKNSEEVSFAQQFDDDSHKVLDALGVSLAMSLGAIDALVVSLVSHANATNQTWPFVTVPDFAVRASKIRALSHAPYLVLYPYVSSQQRAEWEVYSAQHGNDWVVESLAVQEQDVNYQGPILWDYENWDVIHTYENLENPETDKLHGTWSPGACCCVYVYCCSK
jgi:hypothetical protein